MDKYELTRGRGRTKVDLFAYRIGDDIVVCLYNQNAHLGAVAIGEYEHKRKRASTSVITRLGHKDDVLAQKAAYLISKNTKKPVCVIAGVHIDDIRKDEIEEVLKNADSLVNEFISHI